MKQIKIPAELLYVLSILLLALSVAMITCTDFGVSMIVAPAYILSQKIGLTFGQCEYIVQGVLFVVFCIAMRRVKLVYFSSFLTGLFYGAVLDLWRVLIPHFNPAVTVPGTLPLPLKIVYFVCGMTLTSLSIAMIYRVYLYPQVYDFFVKGISQRYRRNRTRFKQIFDFSSLLVSCAMTLLLFRKFVGVGFGTLIMTVCNGFLIGFFDKWLEKHVEVTPLFAKLAGYFDLES